MFVNTALRLLSLNFFTQLGHCILGGTRSEVEDSVKRVRIDDVCAMAAEPLDEWLENLPRDDVQHMALLLYTNLSKGLQKTNTASVVASFLHKSECTIKHWIDDFVSND